MQDFKLNLMRWHLLTSLGKLLYGLAGMLAAADYQEHYRRDLGPAALPTAPTGLSQSTLDTKTFDTAYTGLT